MCVAYVTDSIDYDLFILQNVLIQEYEPVGAKIKFFISASGTDHHYRSRIACNVSKHIMVRHPLNPNSFIISTTGKFTHYQGSELLFLFTWDVFCAFYLF